MKKNTLFLTALTLCALILSACSGQRVSSTKEEKTETVQTETQTTETTTEEKTTEETSTPDTDKVSWINFEAINLDGETVDPDIFAASKLTMVDMWGTFCGPCIREMPHLGEIAKEYDVAEFQIVGIVLDVIDPKGAIDPKQVETAKKIVQQTGANYLQLLPSEDLTELALKEVYSIPEKRFIDSKGNQVGKPIVGSKTKEQWTKIIQEKLKEVEG